MNPADLKIDLAQARIQNMQGLRQPPKFDSFAEERLHRKRVLAAGFRLFSKFGFDEGVAGHITARDPEYTDCFWVNPFAVHFSQISVSDLVLVSHTGELVEGNRSCNDAAFAIHSRIHLARPDVVAAAHSHSLYGKAWSTLGRPLDPLTQDACTFYGDHAVYDEYAGIVFDTHEGDRIADALGPHKAVILRNHGLLTVGQTVEAAVWWFITMERSCQAQLLAEAAGTPKPIAQSYAQLTHDQFGSDFAGWMQFQPLWDRIVKEQPDLLE